MSQNEGAQAKRDTRPWGHWEVLLEEPGYKIKRLVISPGKRMSYQRHARRSEHWTVVQGKALVTRDSSELSLGPGQSLDIPTGAAHRVANVGAEDLVLCEVQLGSYFGEDDIVRLEDDFGRA